MSRPFEHFAAALVALLLTTTSFVAVTTVPDAEAPRAAAPLLA